MDLSPRLDLLAANTREYPYWNRPPIQRAEGITGRVIETMIQDVPINEIPSESRYTEQQVRVLPVPQAIFADVTTAASWQPDAPNLGTGASIGLLDRLMIGEIKRQELGNNS